MASTPIHRTVGAQAARMVSTNDDVILSCSLRRKTAGFWRPVGLHPAVSVLVHEAGVAYKRVPRYASKYPAPGFESRKQPQVEMIGCVGFRVIQSIDRGVTTAAASKKEDILTGSAGPITAVQKKKPRRTPPVGPWNASRAGIAGWDARGRTDDRGEDSGVRLSDFAQFGQAGPGRRRRSRREATVRARIPPARRACLPFHRRSAIGNAVDLRLRDLDPVVEDAFSGFHPCLQILRNVGVAPESGGLQLANSDLVLQAGDGVRQRKIVDASQLGPPAEKKRAHCAPENLRDPARRLKSPRDGIPVWSFDHFTASSAFFIFARLSLEVALVTAPAKVTIWLTAVQKSVELTLSLLLTMSL